jgi:hypothetical protein
LKINFRYKKDNKQATIIEYLLHFLEQHPLKPTFLSFSENASEEKVINVFYGIPKEQPEDYFIPKQSLLFNQTDTQSSSLFANVYLYEQSLLYSVEKKSKPEGPFIIDRNFQFDILETIFFHISRFEEVFAAKEDLNQAGWLEEKKHFLIRNSLHQKPVVDQLVVAFFEAISGTKIHQRTSYDISHDVDILFRLTPFSKFLRSLAANLIYRRGFKDLQNTFQYWWKMQTKGLKDPYDNFEQLLRKESSWKSKQLFLMVGGNTKFDNKYSIDHPYVDNIIQIALERGYEIGLHPSYNAGFEQKRYVEEIKRLSDKLQHRVKLNRQHWLRFNWKITPYLWKENSIKIDYSMGYNQHLGFRCGTGFAYQMFDFKNNKAFQWKEQPLVFMESAAIHLVRKNNENLSKVMTDFLISNNHNTHININFHNSNFDPLLETGRILRKFYEEELIQIIEG